ncbi:MAG TPA: GNAT family N-acetyltransferase [Terriglobales bacterium]|nr:GNAT family N-acetyltransferase [Terriglobales bacterium]
MSLDITIREARTGDVSALLRHRRGMYEAMGYTEAAALEEMALTSENFLERALADGTLRAWLAQSGGRVVAGAGILISPWPSHPYDQQCRRATILNMYVEPEFRRRGIARRLMQIMIEWCRKEGFVNVQLHASDQGRPLYESLGFRPTNEMQLKLRS